MKQTDPIEEFGAELKRRYPYDPRFKTPESLKSFLDQVFGSDGLGKPNATGGYDPDRTGTDNLDDAGHERSGKTSTENADFELLNSNDAWRRKGKGIL